MLYIGILYYYKLILYLKILNSYCNNKVDFNTILYIYYFTNIQNLLHNICKINSIYNRYNKMIKD